MPGFGRLVWEGLAVCLTGPFICLILRDGREVAGEGCGWEELLHGGGGVYDGRGWCEGFSSAAIRYAKGSAWLLQHFSDTRKKDRQLENGLVCLHPHSHNRD